MITGPVAGGLLYGVGAGCPMPSPSRSSAVAVVFALLIPKPPQKTVPEPATWTTVIAGFRYVWREKIVLGAISLDLFAVLLGGAIALLPAYARDILEVGPWGLGLLRSAPGIGALSMALYLAFRPVRDHAGLIMFALRHSSSACSRWSSASRPWSGCRCWRWRSPAPPTW